MIATSTFLQTCDCIGCLRWRKHGGNGDRDGDGIDLRRVGRLIDHYAWAAEEFGAAYFHVEPNRSIEHADDGYDFIVDGVRVDVKHLGFRGDGTPRESGNLLVIDPKLRADRYVLTEGTEPLRFIGWATREDLARRPKFQFRWDHPASFHVPLHSLRGRLESALDEGRRLYEW